MLLRFLLMTIFAIVLAACQTSSAPSGGPSGSGGAGGSGSPAGGAGSGGSGSSGGSGIPGGSGSSGGSGIPGGTGPSGGSGLPGGSGTSGDGESLEELEKTFDESLGEFDDVLAEGSGGAGTSSEGEDVFEPVGEGGEGSVFTDESIGRDKGDSDSGGGAGGAGDAGDSETAGDSASGSSGGGQSAAESERKSSGGEEGERPEPVADIPDDISNGEADDIIARQIREAAEQERDPVLREKLWDEYRKYKAQQ